MAISAKTWARIGAVAFVAFAIFVSAESLRTDRRPQAELSSSTAPEVSRPSDPLIDELLHCQALGQVGASDPDCLRAWAENRRRFLAPQTPPKEERP